MRGQPAVLGTLAVVTAASGFGLLGVLSRLSYEAGVAPIPFVAWRAAIGFAAIALVIAVRVRHGIGRADVRGLARRDRIGLVVVAAAALLLNVAMFLAFDVTTVAIVLLAFYTYPAIVALVAVALGDDHLDPLGWVALTLAIAGMVLVVAGGLGEGSATTIRPLGVVLGLIAALCQTVFITVSRGRFRSVPPEQATGWILGVTAVACAVASIVGAGDLGVPARSGQALVLVTITGLISAGIPSMLFLVGIRIIGATRAGVLMLVEPLVGVTLAAVVLGESLRALQLVGGAAIVVAGALLQRRAPAGETMEPAAVPATEAA
jgi:DME family drug/metabolite transporter